MKRLLTLCALGVKFRAPNRANGCVMWRPSRGFLTSEAPISLSFLTFVYSVSVVKFSLRALRGNQWLL